MISKFTQKVSVFAVLVSMSFAIVSVGQSRRAEAAMGWGTQSYSIAILGACLLGAPGSAIFTIGEAKHKKGHIAIGAFMMILGFVVWDAQTGQTELRAMTIEEVHAVGADATVAELQAYNENIDFLNLVVDQIAAEKPASVEASRALWNQYGADLPREARVGADKIIRALLNKVLSI